VVMDNLSPHKSEPTVELMTRAGVQVLFLPAYSPDLNPIEKMGYSRFFVANTGGKRAAI